MTVVRKKAKKKNFSIIDNGGILDSALSWKATGLWVWLMSKPDNWEVNLENLRHSKSDGKDSVLSALSELEDAGYLVYQRWRNLAGQFESSYTVFESPEQLEEWRQEADVEEINQIAKVSKTKNRDGAATVENPQRTNRDGAATVENPQRTNRDGAATAENQAQLNIDKQSTELISTEKKSPLTPQGGEKQEPALGDFGSKEPTPPTLEVDEVGDTLSQNDSPESLDKHSSSESKEVIAACDNKAISTQSSAYKAEQAFMSRIGYKLPAYRTGTGRNGIKQDFLEWLKSTYLPSTEHYRGKRVDVAQAKGWVLNKEGAGQQELVEVRYEQMLEQQEIRQTQPTSTQFTFTPEQETWVAIAREVVTVSEGAYINITPHREFWRVVSNLAVFNGWLHEVMKVVPLSELPVRLKAWYPECYRLAKQKYPHLRLPEQLDPLDRAG